MGLLPRITADCDPVAGSTRQQVAQTRIEEVLIRQPSGAGDHLWIRLRKNGCSTRQARQAVARAGGIDVEMVRSMGGRDRHAVCEQWFSLPAAAVDSPKAIANAGYKRMITVLQVVASDRPISPGLLRCLRYRLLITKAGEQAAQRARAILDRLRQGGCPNYHPAGFDGRASNFAKWGRMLLEGRRLPAAVLRQRPDRARCLLAAQAWLFNRMVAARIEDGCFDVVLPGDRLRTACQLPPGQRGSEIVTVDEVERAERRCGSWEAVVELPLFGRGMPEAANQAAAREAAMLADSSLDWEQVQVLRGGRRALRFQPLRVGVEIVGSDLAVDCELDEEVFPSVLLEELLHPPGHLR